MSKLARFARPKGAKDRKKRKSKLLRNIAMGAGGAALLGGAAYLGRGKITGLMGTGKPKPGVTKVPYSQLSKEELLSMGGKGRVDARKAAVSRTSQKDDLKYGVLPNRFDDFEKMNTINNAINTNHPGFTKEMLRKMKKERAARIKAYVDRLRKEGAYYSSSSQTTNFHESTMMSLARFARPKGAKDKKKRKSNLLRNIAIGAGGTALIGSAAYLGRGKIAGLMGRTKKSSPQGVAPDPVATTRVSSRQRRLNREKELRWEGKKPGTDSYYLDLDRRRFADTNRAYYQAKKTNSPKLEELAGDKAMYEDWFRGDVKRLRAKNPAIYSTMMSLASFNRKWK